LRKELPSESVPDLSAILRKAKLGRLRIISPLSKVVGYRCCRRTDVDHRGETFELVVPSLVEKVAKPNDASRLGGEVNREPGGAVTKKPRRGIQFPSAVLQVGAGCSEVRNTQGSGGGEQGQILLIPKTMLARGSGSHRFSER